MKLEEAYVLLDVQGRVFAEVAKHYNWKDDAELKDYTDFILHEPAQWMSGYPIKYADKSQFGKPKTALVKLMKNAKVQEAYGEEYTTSVRDAVWNAYKQVTKAAPEEHPPAPLLEVVEDMDAVSLHSMKVSKKDRSEVLGNALRAFIEAEKEKHPGLAAVALTLLDSFLETA